MASTLGSYDPFAPAVVANPYPYYARMRESERAPLLEPFGMHLITRYGDVAAILRNHELFSSDERKASQVRQRRRTSTGATVLNSDPPDHTRLRALVTRRFSARTATASWEDEIRQIVDRLVDDAAKKDVIDIIHEIAVPLPVMVIAKAIGIPAADYERFKQWSDNEVANNGPQTPPEEMERLQQSSEELHGYFVEAIRRARDEANDGRDDLIATLTSARDASDSLSETELVEFLVLLLLAGNETTTNLIGNGMLALARNPAQQRRLREHPELLGSAVEELVRFDGPVQSTRRILTGPATVHGIQLARGDSVAVVLAGANRDPAFFADPDALDVARTDRGHVGFGHGLHFCLGAPLARLEAKHAFRALLERLPQLALAVPDESLAYTTSFFLRGLKALPVRRAC